MLLAQPHYDEEVHEPYLGFPESANLTSEELLDLTIIERTNLEASSTYIKIYTYCIILLNLV